MQQSKRLRVMAGPNGSGKSTILKAIRSTFYSGPFVNADEIEKSFREKRLLNPYPEFGLQITDIDFATFLNGLGKSWLEKAQHEQRDISIKSEDGILVVKKEPSAYDAALAADFIRHKLLEKEETFTFETVLSHPSKIRFLEQGKAAGFKNYLYFICTVSPEINIKRIHQRVQLGGHDVPEDKVRKRYHESLQLLSKIIPLCYRVFLFDNSFEEPSIEPVAEIDKKSALIVRNKEVPWWIQKYVIEPLYH